MRTTIICNWIQLQYSMKVKWHYNNFPTNGNPNILTGYILREKWALLTRSQCTLSIPLENIRKPSAVFLTHVGIRQIPTWLPTWKAKSLYHVGTFLPTWFFLPLQKFKTTKIKAEKNPQTQTIGCLLQIVRDFKDIFKHICFALYL